MRAYVANAYSNSVTVIDTVSEKVVATVLVGHNPVDVAVTSTGSAAYVANAGSNSVSVIDTTSNNVAKTVTVGNRPVEVAIH
jgi:YVTN family beta-propeller protein